MLKLLKVCLINPGEDLVMCTSKRKNVNHTDQIVEVTCPRCIDNYLRNQEWWLHKLPKELKRRLEGTV